MDVTLGLDFLHRKKEAKLRKGRVRVKISSQALLYRHFMHIYIQLDLSHSIRMIHTRTFWK